MALTREQLAAALLPIILELQQIIGEVKEEAATSIPEVGKLSKRTLIELAAHEGAVREAYKDSKGIWTWGIGVTDKSGHKVLRYKDNPQSLQKVFEIYEWLLRTRYLPDVLEAFKGKELQEHELAAALSFHYNTGAIKRASWVKSYLKGDIRNARIQFMQWRKPPEIVHRRQKERDLFFDGVWSNTDGMVPVFEVRKPSYTPKWGSAKKVKYGEEL